MLSQIRKSHPLPLATLLLIGGLSTSAQAGLISINSAPLSSDGSELSSLGSVLHVWNVYGNEGVMPIVNGIMFSDAQPAEITTTGFDVPASVQDNVLNTNHYDAAMDEIMEDFWVTPHTVDGTLTVNGLMVGQTYQLQFLHHHDILSSSGRTMEVHFGDSAAGVGGGIFAAGDDQGYITTILFTADATSQTSYFRSNSIDRVTLNGVVVTTSVPEPMSLILFGLGLAGLGLSRRKSQLTAL